MNRTKLYLLLMLLKAYRAYFCWDGDRYSKNINAVIRDVRFALEHGGFYSIDRMMIQ